MEDDKTYTMGIKGRVLTRLRTHKVHPRATDSATVELILDELAGRQPDKPQPPKKQPNEPSPLTVKENPPTEEPF